MKIWERYFIKELLKTLFLFLFSFYGLYVLIDYASHTTSFHHSHVRPTWHQLFVYYTADLTKRIDVLLPFALLIATIRTLCQLNMHNELMALLASGISKRRLLVPFLGIALICSCLLYLNNQFILPNALLATKNTEEKYAKLRNKQERAKAAQHFLLKDGSTVLYSDYDDQELLFHDVYWVISADNIYHMKTLSVLSSPPIGNAVEHLMRDSADQLIVAEAMPTHSFDNMRFTPEQLFDTVTPPEELSLSTLFQKMPEASSFNSEKESQLLTVFYRKLAMPLMCLLAVLAPAPFCFRFSRTLEIFMIYACSLFGLVAFYLILDASSVLGKRQVVPPAAAIWAPFVLVFCWCGYRFTRD